MHDAVASESATALAIGPEWMPPPVAAGGLSDWMLKTYVLAQRMHTPTREASRRIARRDRILRFFDFAGNVFDVVADGSPVASSRDIVRTRFRYDAHSSGPGRCFSQQKYTPAGCRRASERIKGTLIEIRDPKDRRIRVVRIAVRAAAELHRGSRITAGRAAHRTTRAGSVTAAANSCQIRPLASAHHASNPRPRGSWAACHGKKDEDPTVNRTHASS